MIKQLILAALAALVTGPVQATLFVDTFDRNPATTDINAGIASRQSGGTVSSTYTFTTGHNVVGADGGFKLRRLSSSKTTLDHDFAGDLGSADYSLSFDFKSVATGVEWSSVYLKSTTDSTRGKSPLQVYFRGDNTSGDLIHLQYGTGSAVSHLSLGASTIASALGESFSINDEHSYSFVASASSATSGTYDFVIDGTVVANDLAYSFSDSTSRQVEFIGLVGHDARWDNLTVIPEPATLGLVSVLGGGVFFIRRIFLL